MVNKSKNFSNNTEVPNSKNIGKKIKIINNNGNFNHNDQLNSQAQNIRNFNTNAVHSYNNNNHQQQQRTADGNNINIVNVINN